MGVQLVGRRGDDARLLRTARWLPRLDLGAVIAITLLLAGWDLLSGFVRKPGAR
jgi:hypothetical protein